MKTITRNVKPIEGFMNSIMDNKSRKLFLMILVGIITCFLFSVMLFVNCFASDNTNEALYKYYTPVKVSYADTLNGLAEDYVGIGYDSVEDYANEVKKINHIKDSDMIYEGQTIIFPYYDEILK